MEIDRTTLRALADTHGLDQFDLVCDIEGAEAGIFSDELGWLDRCGCMVIELHHTHDRGRDLRIVDLTKMIGGLGDRRTFHDGAVYVFNRDG